MEFLFALKVFSMTALYERSNKKNKRDKKLKFAFLRLIVRKFH